MDVVNSSVFINSFVVPEKKLRSQLKGCVELRGAHVNCPRPSAGVEEVVIVPSGANTFELPDVSFEGSIAAVTAEAAVKTNPSSDSFSIDSFFIKKVEKLYN